MSADTQHPAILVGGDRTDVSIWLRQLWGFTDRSAREQVRNQVRKFWSSGVPAVCNLPGITAVIDTAEAPPEASADAGHGEATVEVLEPTDADLSKYVEPAEVTHR